MAVVAQPRALPGQTTIFGRRIRFHWPSPQYFFLVPLGFASVLPIIYVVSTAFKPLEELLLYPPPFFVRRPTMDNFLDLLWATNALAVPFSRYLFNSVFVTLATVLLQVLFASMCAYPLSKARGLPGSGVVFSMIIAALMFAPEVTRIPQYLVVQKLGLIDTYWALIVPALPYALGLFMMKQFMDNSVDMALIEAARIDGAGEWTIFWRVVMPNVAPAWNTLLIFGFIAQWRDSFSPVVFTRSEAMRTVAVAMIALTNGPATVARLGAQAAAAFLMTAPSIIVFLLRQAKVIQTMAHSGIKA
jgi:ABC-type glycerol-3-phosphate transport system permease component